MQKHRPPNSLYPPNDSSADTQKLFRARRRMNDSSTKRALKFHQRPESLQWKNGGNSEAAQVRT